MNLELLPNEILLDLFEYFNGIDLLRTFYGLNARFNFLLYKQFRLYCFRFFSISKRNFDMLCQQHLPFIADQVYALRLSDSDYTPEQINLFFSYISSFKSFTHLRSLSLSSIHSYQTLIKIIHECQHLSNLTHLDFQCYSFKKCEVDSQLIIDTIWSLPKLRYCDFSIYTRGQQNWCIPTKISSTLESVNMRGYNFKWNQINELFHYTPCLKHCSICITSSDDDNYVPLPLPTLTKLNIIISCTSNPSKMISFFQNIPNLRHLNLTTFSTLINGHQLEQIIRDYFPKLKVFRLQMKDIFFTNQNIQERVDVLIDSFQSSFWIDEHRWFVRCITYKNTITLCTLSESFHYSESNGFDLWRSTYPDDNQQNFYNDMTSIYREDFFDQTFPSDIFLPNIRYLFIKLPINDQFWSIVSNLNRLYSLNVSSHVDTYQSQLQTLLDRAPQLTHLRISQDKSLPPQMSLFKYTNASIRELDLQKCNYWFNEEECMALCHSPLGVQCQLLFIHVQKRESIVILIKNMVNLRALHIECEDEKLVRGECTSVLPNISSYFYTFLRTSLYVLVLLGNLGLLQYRSTLFPPYEMFCKQSTSKVDLVQWLKHHLPSTCSISKEPDSTNRLRIWIQ